MEHSLKYSWSLRRTADGPLAPYIDGFKGRLCTLGYSPRPHHTTPGPDPTGRVISCWPS